MSIIPPLRSLTPPARQSEYLVSHGKSGGFGRFVAVQPIALERGARVVIVSARGREVGSVLFPANPRHGQYLGGASSGKLLCTATAQDGMALSQLATLMPKVF